MSEGYSFTEFLNYQSNRHQFMLKHVAISTVASVIFGMTGGMLGSHLFPMALGPIAPYLLFSTTGFGFGSLFVWRQEVNRALFWSKRYPDVIEHHLQKSYMDLIDEKRILLKVKTNEKLNFGDLSWLILGTQAAAPDIELLQNQRLAGILEQYSANSDEEMESPDET